MEGRQNSDSAHQPSRATAVETARNVLAELAARAAQGDHDALSELHRRLSGGLVRWFQRTWPQDPERCDSLAHETWTLVWQSLRDGRYDPRRAAITTFAFAIAGNMRLRELRRIGKSFQSQSSDDSQEIDSDPAESLERASLLETVRRVLVDPEAGLQESDRVILGLLARGMGDRDIARELGVSPSTGHERKRKALERLASLLRSLGLDVLDEEATTAISGGNRQ